MSTMRHLLLLQQRNGEEGPALAVLRMTALLAKSEQ
jgi:hypothetical protein